MTVRTYWAWTGGLVLRVKFGSLGHCYVASARRRARAWVPTGGGEGRGISCRHAHNFLSMVLVAARLCKTVKTARDKTLCLLFVVVSMLLGKT